MSSTAVMIALFALGADIETSVETAPQGEVHGRSRTFLMVGSRPYVGADTNVRGALEDRRFMPAIEDLSIDARPGVEGLTIALDAWGALDTGQLYYLSRTIADLTEGYVRYHRRDFDARAGRLFLFSDVGRGLRVDGGELVLHPATDLGPAHLSLDTYAGVPVIPLYGEEPIQGDRPEALRDPLALGQGGSRWNRPGSFAFGALAGARFDQGLDIGVGYAHQTEYAEIEREDLVARLRYAPDARLSINGYGSYNLFAHGFEDAELDASTMIDKLARVTAYARSRTPALLLPSTSIFSVFGNETHRELGLEGDLFVSSSARASLAGEMRRTDAEGGVGHALGYRAYAAVRSRLPLIERGRGLLSYERLEDGWFGRYDYLRAGTELPLVGTLGANIDGAIFFIHRTSLGLDTSEVALRGGAGLSYVYETIRAVLAVRTTRTQAVPFETAIIGRLEWNVDRTF
jgi:hypothetical protein